MCVKCTEQHKVNNLLIRAQLGQNACGQIILYMKYELNRAQLRANVVLSFALRRSVHRTEQFYLNESEKSAQVTVLSSFSKANKCLQGRRVFPRNARQSHFTGSSVIWME